MRGTSTVRMCSPQHEELHYTKRINENIKFEVLKFGPCILRLFFLASALELFGFRWSSCDFIFYPFEFPLSAFGALLVLLRRLGFPLVSVE